MQSITTIVFQHIKADIEVARAFAELVSYIESNVENGMYIFKLSELHGLYEGRLHRKKYQ